MIEIIPNWHPFLVHFTVALPTVAAVFFLVSKFAVNWRLEDQWLAAGYWSLWLGTLVSIGTVAAGWYAFNTVTHDTPSHEVMLEHRNLALITLAVYTGLSIWALLGYRAKKEPSLVLVVAIFLSLGLLFNTAWHGAELVYKHGLGVKSLPNPAAHAHAPGSEHEHAGGVDAEHAHDAAVEHEHKAESVGAAHEHAPGTEHEHKAESAGAAHEHAPGTEHEHETAAPEHKHSAEEAGHPHD